MLKFGDLPHQAQMTSVNFIVCEKQIIVNAFSTLPAFKSSIPKFLVRVFGSVQSASPAIVNFQHISFSTLTAGNHEQLIYSISVWGKAIGNKDFAL